MLLCKYVPSLVPLAPTRPVCGDMQLYGAPIGPMVHGTHCTALLLCQKVTGIRSGQNVNGCDHGKWPNGRTTWTSTDDNNCDLPPTAVANFVC